MWATGTPRDGRRLVVGWAVFATVNVAVMWFVPGQETIPFHFVWIGLALVYGLTTWHRGAMFAALVAVTVSTGAILVHHAATGEIRWEETSEVPLMAAIFGVMVWHVHRRQQALGEVHRLAEAERQRLEVQQLLVRLASHELRTPITVARGYTELVRRAHPDPGTGTDTDIVLDELDKLTRITHRLVTLMQVDGTYPIDAVDVDAQLLRIVRRWQPTADRDWLVRTDLGSVPANAERLETAVDCLLDNAVKFTRPGDRVSVTGRRESGDWVVEVRDSGAGLTGEEVAALSAGPPSGGTSTGTGLGLVIVRAVAGSLGGSVRLTSEPAAGTVVTLRMPLPGPPPGFPLGG